MKDKPTTNFDLNIANSEFNKLIDKAAKASGGRLVKTDDTHAVMRLGSKIKSN